MDEVAFQASSQSAPAVVVALGSNLGDSRTIVSQALRRIRTWSAGSFRASSLWNSSPVDCPPGSPSFVNAVCLLHVDPTVTPESFLVWLQSIERDHGRTPTRGRHQARPLDLDLIAWGNLERSTPFLVLPHPRAHQRRFVLEPLNEIAPDLQLPGWPDTTRHLLTGLQTAEQVIRLAPGT